MEEHVGAGEKGHFKVDHDQGGQAVSRAGREKTQPLLAVGAFLYNERWANMFNPGVEEQSVVGIVVD